VAHDIPDRLLTHLASEVSDTLDMSPSEATSVVEAAMADWRRTHGAEPGYFYKASELLAVLRATPRLPGGRSWWSSPVGHRALDFLTGATPAASPLDEAYMRVAETLAQLAEPAPDEFDQNWPDTKVAWVMVRPESKVGDTFVVGDGMGLRVTIQIIEREDELIATADRHADRHYLFDIEQTCRGEISSLLGES
jgi:hypothetical protein